MGTTLSSYYMQIIPNSFCYCVYLYLNSSSPFLGFSGLLFISTFHIYRLCYIVSLCICLGQLISGYGLAKGFYIILLSTLELSSLLLCILIILISIWYPITWLFWLYMTLRPGVLLPSFYLVNFKGFSLSQIIGILWSWLLLVQFYVLFILMLLYF